MLIPDAELENSNIGWIPISFNTPLAEEAKPKVVHVKANGTEVYASSEGTETDCDGDSKAPKADPGFLCIYTDPESLVFGTPEFANSIRNSHGVARRVQVVGGPIGMFGSWAVTAPTS